MISQALKAKFLVFAVFFVGIATGVLIVNLYETRVIGNQSPPSGRFEREQRRQRAQRNISEFHEYLGLNEPQKQEINQILEETRNEFRRLREETQPKYRALEDASRSKIRTVLDEGQRLKYDEYLKTRDSRSRSGGRDRGAKDAKR